MVIEKVENIIKSCKTHAQLEVAGKCVDLYLKHHIGEIESRYSSIIKKKVVKDLTNLVEWQKLFVK